MIFEVSGVECPFWLPPLVAFAVSYFTAMGGLSGAFLLLPFNMSVLGFTSPAVSPTNLVYNLVGIPGGVYRYFREGRMVWPLVWVVVVGTLPGLAGGIWVRLKYLPSPGPFKVFVGCVLLYMALRMFKDLWRPPQGNRSPNGGDPADWKVQGGCFTFRLYTFSFRGSEYACSVPLLFGLALGVGVVGGIYGIGGGAILAPLSVSIVGLPVHAVAGATLMGTFVTSVAGVVLYQFLAPLMAAPGMVVVPDWTLGVLYGLGGLAGMYLGARTQRLVPDKYIKGLLGLLLLFVAVRYIGVYFL